MTTNKHNLNKEKTAMKNIVNSITNQDPTMNINMKMQHCSITNVNGFQYLTLPETNLMDYVGEDKNIETAASAVRDETTDPHLTVSQTKVEMCNYILESDEMKEIVRQNLLRGVYSHEAIAVEMNL